MESKDVKKEVSQILIYNTNLWKDFWDCNEDWKLSQINLIWERNTDWKDIQENPYVYYCKK